VTLGVRSAIDERTAQRPDPSHGRDASAMCVAAYPEAPGTPCVRDASENGEVAQTSAFLRTLPNRLATSFQLTMFQNAST
jgi:hypothetical protein